VTGLSRSYNPDQKAAKIAATARNCPQNDR